MRRLESLAQDLRKAARAAMEAPDLDRAPLSTLSTWAGLAQAAHLLKLSSRLGQAGKLAAPGMAFDRFLLSHSRHYLRTRRLARTLGMKLIPGLTSKERALYTFDPLSEVYVYSPIEPELVWLLREPRSPRVLERVRQLWPYTSSTYHDLNHTIFFRLVSPAQRQLEREEIRFYFYLVESLALLRDVQLAEELGYVSVPLQGMRALYRHSALAPEYGRFGENFEFDDFRALQLFSYFQNAGHTKSGVERAFRSAGIPLPNYPAKETRREFLDETSEKWLDFYEERYRGKLRLPRSCASTAKHRVRILRPEEWILDTGEQQRLYRWYCRVFP